MPFFSRDIRLHKLVFEEGGLPDGTEVAYYARGQVVEINNSNVLTYFCVLLMCDVSLFPRQKLLGVIKWASVYFVVAAIMRYIY